MTDDLRITQPEFRIANEDGRATHIPFPPSGQTSDFDVIRFKLVTREAKVRCMWEMKMLSRQVSKMILSRLNETDEPKSTVSRTSSRIESPATKNREMSRPSADRRASLIHLYSEAPAKLLRRPSLYRRRVTS